MDDRDLKKGFRFEILSENHNLENDQQDAEDDRKVSER